MSEFDKHLNNNKTSALQTADIAALSESEQLFAQGYRAVSDSAAGKKWTYGEKLHYNIFDVGCNFLLNLGVSAVFTHWVKHSKAPVWKNAPFAKKAFSKAPEEAHKYVKGLIRDSLKVSDGIAGKMTDAVTLTTGGHFVMIPAVYIGEKIKTNFVQSADRRHYGADKVENDPWIVHRHQFVNQEDKPTLFGSVVGRIGTMIAVPASAMVLGDRKNLIQLAGKHLGSQRLEKFSGLDSWAGQVGDASGKVIADLSPTLSKRANDFTRSKHFSFSKEQVAKGATGEYNTAVRDFGKYTALDTFYTWVTMATIRPAIHYAQKLVPYITSKEDPITARPGVLVNQIEHQDKMQNLQQQRA